MENYFMNYDAATGQIKGFYLRSLHGDKIPSPTLEITEERYKFYLEHNGQYKLNTQTLEDELIQTSAPQIQIPSYNDRLNAIEDAMSKLMGV